MIHNNEQIDSGSVQFSLAYTNILLMSLDYSGYFLNMSLRTKIV